MRITYLHQYFNTPSMSGGTRSYEMARRLVVMGHQVNLITSWQKNDGRKGWFVTEEAGVKVHWLPVHYSNQMDYKTRLKAFLKFAFGAAHRASTIPADIILASSTPLTIAIPGAYSAWRQQIPMVFEVRDLWPTIPLAVGALKSPITKFLAKSLEKFAYSRSQFIIALSPGMRDGVVSAGYPGDRIDVVPNCADLDRFYPNEEARNRFREKHGVPKDKILVVYAGTFGLINGVDYLVHVAEKLKNNPKIFFLLVGDGQKKDGAVKLAQQTGCLNHNLLILPPLPKKDISEVFAAADIATSLFLPIPEMESNSANKFFDGLAAGCCMAINHGGWQAELLSSSGAGLRLSRNIDEASRQLENLASNSRRIVESGIKARELAENLFSRDNLAEKLERLLSKTYERSKLEKGLSH